MHTGSGAEALTRPREEALLGALTELMSRWTSADLQARFAVQHGVKEAARGTPAFDDAKVRAIYVLGLRGGAARPSVLAAELRMTRPTTSKLLARLRADGLLDKRDDPTDGRASQVELTTLGRDVFARLVGAGHDMVRRALGGWSEADIELLSGLLSRFVDGLMDEASGMTQADGAGDAAGERQTAPASAAAPQRTAPASAAELASASAPQSFAQAPAGAPAPGTPRATGASPK